MPLPSQGVPFCEAISRRGWRCGLWSTACSAICDILATGRSCSSSDLRNRENRVRGKIRQESPDERPKDKGRVCPERPARCKGKELVTALTGPIRFGIHGGWSSSKSTTKCPKNWRPHRSRQHDLHFRH